MHCALHAAPKPSSLTVRSSGAAVSQMLEMGSVEDLVSALDTKDEMKQERVLEEGKRADRPRPPCCDQNNRDGP